MVAAGACIAWPTARLCMSTPRSVVATVAWDAATIVVLVHITLFPLRALAGWSRERLLMLDASLMCAIALASSVLLIGLRTNASLRRTLAALALVFIAVGPEAPWVAMGIDAPSVARALPGALSVAWNLSAPIAGPVDAVFARDALAAAIIAVAVVGVAVAWVRRPVTLA